MKDARNDHHMIRVGIGSILPHRHFKGLSVKLFSVQCSGFILQNDSRQILNVRCLLLFGPISPLNFDRLINLHYLNAFSFLPKQRQNVLNQSNWIIGYWDRRIMIEKIMDFGSKLAVTYIILANKMLGFTPKYILQKILRNFFRTSKYFPLSLSHSFIHNFAILTFQNWKWEWLLKLFCDLSNFDNRQSKRYIISSAHPQFKCGERMVYSKKIAHFWPFKSPHVNHTELLGMIEK